MVARFETSVLLSWTAQCDIATRVFLSHNVARDQKYLSFFARFVSLVCNDWH